MLLAAFLIKQMPWLAPSMVLNPDALAGREAIALTPFEKWPGPSSCIWPWKDEALYPALLKHPDPQVRTTAKRFIDEMGGIKVAFEQYLDRWPTPASISSRSSVFVKETQGVFDALARRIARENDELYPLFH